jgi:hypothetical protein
MLAPYLHGKHGTIPTPIYIDAKVHLPHPNPTKLDQVRDYLTNLKLSAQIDTATADSQNSGAYGRRRGCRVARCGPFGGQWATAPTATATDA